KLPDTLAPFGASVLLIQNCNVLNDDGAQSGGAAMVPHPLGSGMIICNRTGQRQHVFVREDALLTSGLEQPCLLEPWYDNHPVDGVTLAAPGKTQRAPIRNDGAHFLVERPSGTAIYRELAFAHLATSLDRGVIHVGIFDGPLQLE